jgi:hypothetical protein
LYRNQLNCLSYLKGIFGVGFAGEEEENLNRTSFGVTLAIKSSLISCHVTELQIPIG